MNGASVHLLFNHIPVIGVPLCFLLLLAGLFRRSSEIIQISFAAFLLMALLTIPAYKSGSPAARLIRGLPGISRDTVREHARAATTAYRAVGLLGVMGAAGFWFSRRPGAIPMRFAVASLLVAVIVSGWLAWVAHLGGLIRHPEIRSEYVAPNPVRQSN